ncbi:MAG TPA: carbonic anhydrase [Casimicrobiaceae bacterium]|nr:carbonic anhydrase [Casimicrobiaceae bacterium]
MANDEIVQRLRRFRAQHFPRFRRRFEQLVKDGQHPTVLFIGCADSRIVPYLITGTGPGELFIVRNVGAFVPPFDASRGYHGTSAAIEFAVLALDVRDIVVCGHSHCGGIRALYDGVPAEAVHMAEWLELGRDAVLPEPVSPDVLRRTEQRAVMLQLERLMSYPMVAIRVAEGRIALHGWHYVIEEGDVHVLDLESGDFVPASQTGGDAASADPAWDVSRLQ